jgi:hypothetical protein
MAAKFSGLCRCFMRRLSLLNNWLKGAGMRTQRQGSSAALQKKKVSTDHLSHVWPVEPYEVHQSSFVIPYIVGFRFSDCQAQVIRVVGSSGDSRSLNQLLWGSSIPERASSRGKSISTLPLRDYIIPPEFCKGICMGITDALMLNSIPKEVYKSWCCWE